MQQNFTQNQQQNQPPPMPPSKPEYSFRWGLFFGVPLAIIVLFCIVKNIETFFNLEELFDCLHVIERFRYGRLAILSIICLVFLIIVKLLRNKRN